MNKPHKHAEVIKAWADGKTIQLFWNGRWSDCNQETFQFDVAHQHIRIKPEPKYPETRMTAQELACVWSAKSDQLSVSVAMTDIANAAIRRAIQDGDVVLPGEKE